MKNRLLFLALHVLIIIALLAYQGLDARAQSVKEPIIIIPGIAASWNYKVMLGKGKNQWRFFPGTHNYDSLIQFFKDHGYEEKKTLYTFFYDWRQHNQDTADQLKNLIQTAKQSSGQSKVNLIAHSMGGIVARLYIQGTNYQNDVDQLIMMGTPNQGSSDVYTLWEGGEVPRNWDTGYRFGINTYLWYLDKTFNSVTHYTTIHDKIPSVGELLPAYPFLTDSANPDTFRDPQPDNGFFAGLNSFENLFDRLGSRAQVTTIASQGVNTVNTIPVKDSPDTVPRWSFGQPDPNPPVRNDSQGDNRVLLSSAHLPDAIVPVYHQPSFWQRMLAWIGFLSLTFADDPHTFNQKTIDNVNHGDLPHRSIDTISSLLGITKVVDPIPPKNLAKSLAILVGSPVTVSVTDPNGRLINATTNQIPDADYDDDGEIDGNKMIVIPDPIDGLYQLNLVGVNLGGDYHVGALLLNDDEEVNQTVQSQIQPNQTQTLKLAVNGQETTINLEAPQPPTKAELWAKLKADAQEFLSHDKQVDKEIDHAQKKADKSLHHYQNQSLPKLIYQLLVNTTFDHLGHKLLKDPDKKDELNDNQKTILRQDIETLRSWYLAG